MTGRFFGNSAANGGSRLSADSKLECKICWHVYDPAEGDVASQIPAGTAFTDLPTYWTCPECGSDKTNFLVLDD